jgi:hypothetical protein
MVYIILFQYNKIQSIIYITFLEFVYLITNKYEKNNN